MSCSYQELCDPQMFYENRVFKYIYFVCECVCMLVSVGMRTFTSTHSPALALTHPSVSSL